MKQKDLPTTSTLCRLLLLLLLLIFLHSQDLSAQAPSGGANCEVFKKLGGIPEGYGGKVYYDRFGNTWTSDEITALTIQVTDECTAGVFKLYFSGNYTIAERDQVCNALSYLSSIAGSGSPTNVVPLKIEFVAGLQGGAASQFMEPECGTMKNYALENIRTKTNQLAPGFSAGLIQIGSDINWYAGPEVDLANWNSDHVGQIDLFTAVLHEGMHLLGVASTWEGNAYSIWDRYLYKKVGPFNYISLIEDANDPLCCTKKQKNPNAPTNFPANCAADIVFKNLNAEVKISSAGPEPSPGNPGSINNRLSHLNIACSADPNAGAYQYVMHPIITPSPSLYSFPRRTLTPDELSILCGIGYKTNSACFTCVTEANDDYRMLFLNSSPSSNPLRLIASLSGGIGNDGIFATGVPLVSNDVYNEVFVSPNPFVLLEFCGSDNEITVVPVYSGTYPQLIVRFDVYPTVPGIFKFCYRLTSCNQPQNCDEATVYVQVLENPVSTFCDVGCNLVCFGNFEDFEIMPYYIPNYYPQLNLPFFQFENYYYNNSPDVFLQGNVDPDNKVLAWFKSTPISDQNSLECVRMPLSQPLDAGCETTIHYRATTKVQMGSPFENRIEVYGLTAPPCTEIANQPIWGGEGISFPFCSGVTGYAMDLNLNPGIDPDVNVTLNPTNESLLLNNLNLQDYTFTYTHPAGAAPITDLLILGDFTAPSTTATQSLAFFMDDFSAFSSCDVQLTITPTITSQCISGQAVISYKLCLLGGSSTSVPINLQVQIPPGMTAVAGGGFDANGLASLQMVPGTQCAGGSNTATITLTMNVTGNYNSAQGPIPVDVPLELVNTSACIDQTVAEGGEVTLLLQDCTIAAACHCPSGTGYEVGNNSGSVVNLSTSVLPAVLQNTCLTVSGRLIVDRDFKLDNTHVIMNRGAEIVVKSTVTLEVTNASLMEGCAHMWRGITVENGGKLVMTNGNIIRDAQWAVQALHGSTINVADNYFDQNYVGIYVPPSTKGSKTVHIVAITANKFRCLTPLKPAYTIPSALEQIPIPGTYTYAGIAINDVVGFNIGKKNDFNNIRNAVFAVNSGFTIDDCMIHNLVADPANLNLEFNYNVNQHGIYADYCSLAKITNCVFNQIGKGIYSRATNITADYNTMTGFNSDSPADDSGIECSLNTNKAVRIRNNTITMWGPGIYISNAQPASILRVKNNQVSAYADSYSAHIDLQQIRGGYVGFNVITRNYATAMGIGIQMTSCSSLNVDANRTNGLERGFDTQACTGNTFTGNEALLGGKNGFEIFNSTDTYCSNKSEGQTDNGFYFKGMCIKANALRCNRIGNAGANGLRLWSDGSINTKIGTQTNGGNLWNGAYGNFGAYNEAASFSDILGSQFRLPTGQIPTWSTTLGQTAAWFFPISNNPLVCLLACPYYTDTDNQYPPTTGGSDGLGGLDDQDIKSAQNGHAGDGFNWMARQRLYEQLRQSPAVAAQNSYVQQFYDSAPATDLGQLYQVGSDLALLEGRDAYTWGAIGNLQQAIAGLSDALQTLLLTGPGQDYAAWWTQILVLQQQIRESTNRLTGNEKWLEALRQNEAPIIIAANAAVVPSNICALNQQTINGIYLNNALWSNQSLSTSTLQQVKSIADQCPLDGGFAVYAARSLYHRFVRSAIWDPASDCSGPRSKSGNSEGGKVADVVFSLVPNPANQVLQVTPNTGLDQEVQLELFNLVGKSVATLKIAGISGVALDTRLFPAGVYFYKITGQGKLLQSGKIMIAH